MVLTVKIQNPVSCRSHVLQCAPVIIQWPWVKFTVLVSQVLANTKAQYLLVDQRRSELKTRRSTQAVYMVLKSNRIRAETIDNEPNTSKHNKNLQICTRINIAKVYDFPGTAVHKLPASVAPDREYTTKQKVTTPIQGNFVRGNSCVNLKIKPVGQSCIRHVALSGYSSETGHSQV